MTPPSPSYQVVVFPWVGLRSGQCLEWEDHGIAPWRDVREQVLDVAVRDQVDRIVECYTDRPSRSTHDPSRGLSVFTRNFPDLRPLDSPAMLVLARFRSVLSLGALGHSMPFAAHRYGGHGIVFSEHLDYFVHGVAPGSDSFSYSAGIVVNVTAGGMDLGDTVIPRPLEIAASTSVQCDSEILRGLSLAQSQAPVAFERILAAAELLYTANHNTHIVPEATRVVLLVAALESLLDISAMSKTTKSRALRDRVEEACAREWDKRTPLPATSEQGEPERTVFGHWAYSIYRLRNQLLHSAHRPENDFSFRGQHHALIGTLVFLQCLQSELATIAHGAGHDLAFSHLLRFDDSPRSSRADPDEVVGFKFAPDYSRLAKLLFDDCSPGSQQT